jgi:hypothetical protein
MQDMKSKKKSNETEIVINKLMDQLNNHKTEANKFYQIKSKLKKDFSHTSDTLIICYDFEKNLQLPITNINMEYYLSKFYMYNFGIHNLTSSETTMFLYPENFARKTPNEVISFINYYLDNTNNLIKNIYIFSDNCFSQNKNKFLWAYYY